MDREKKQQIVLALILSLLLHVGLVSVLYLLADMKITPPEKEEVMEVDLRLDQEWKIADIAPPKVEKRPKVAKHIGIHDSSVEDEMVAASTPRAPGRPESRGGKGMDEIKQELTKADSHFQEKEEIREVIRLTEKEKSSPSLGSMQSSLDDYYPDYKRGPHTYINVMKHKDAAYFVRLKRVFKLAWDPTHVLREHFYAGEVSRGRIRVVLGFSISPTGALDEIFVINSSGLKGYDREAMRAVRASAPFSSPPKKFLDKDGILRVSWSFVVYL